MATVIRRRADYGCLPQLAPLAGALSALLLLFGRDVADMAGLWWNSSTYQHCLFILPIVAWLIWQRREELRPVPLAAWPPGLALVFGAALVWLMGEAGGVSLVRHVGVVLMVQATVIAVAGPAMARAIAFPLFYLLFLVPFGDEFIGPMQTLTARMCMVLLHLTGVPATIDGVFITIPNGWFEVAEACSGVKFLVAMFAYGTLVAHVGFRSPVRRGLFMVAAVVMPVLANGVRAFGTIYVAHLTSVKFATGFDHIVYGWFFFAFVTLILMAAAWPFFDRRIGDDWLGGKAFPLVRPTAAIPVIAVIAVLVAALPAGWDAWASRAGRVSLPVAVDLPAIPNWRRTGDWPATPWTPRFDGADHKLIGRYGDAKGHRVDLAVALYGWQAKGREIVGFGQGAIDTEGHWAWASDSAPVPGGKAERMLGMKAVPREAVTFWIVSGDPGGSRAQVKLRTMLARLTGGDQSAATVIVSAEGPDARAAIDAFLKDMGSPQALAQGLITRAKGR